MITNNDEATDWLVGHTEYVTLTDNFSLPTNTVTACLAASPSSRWRGLYVITDARMGGSPANIDLENYENTGQGHLEMTRAALSGGARIIQLRDKPRTLRPLRQLLDIATEMRRLTHQAGALFVINDRVDVALACDADAVHLGPDDMPIAVARRIAPHLALGASCGTPEEAFRACSEGATYIGAGAIFGTQTKHDAGAAIGLETLKAIVQVAGGLPVAAIGGVTVNNIASTFKAGASMACVVSAIGLAGETSAMTAVTETMVKEIER